MVAIPVEDPTRRTYRGVVPVFDVCGDCRTALAATMIVAAPAEVPISLGKYCEGHLFGLERHGRDRQATNAIVLLESSDETPTPAVRDEEPPPPPWEAHTPRGKLGPVTQVAAQLVASWTSGKPTEADEVILQTAVSTARALLSLTENA